MFNKPIVDAKNIAELFSEYQTYHVPAYQRDYAWEVEQVRDLLEDFELFFQSEDPYYVLGQVILAPGGQGKKHESSFAIVDGQQRLTTLFLLFISLREQFNTLNVSTTEQSEERIPLRMLTSAMSFIRPSDGEEIPRLSAIRQAQGAINDLLTHSLRTSAPNSVSEQNVRNNIDEINKWVAEHLATRALLSEFTLRLLRHVYIITAILDTEEQALEIFEKINSRGKPLSTADLFKNLLFMNVSTADAEIIDNYWMQAGEEVFRVKPHKAASMEYLMQALLQPHTGKFVASKDVYRAWQPILKAQSEPAEVFAKGLLTSAQKLAQLGSVGSNHLNKDYIASKYFGVVQHLPIALTATRFLSSNADTYQSVCRFLDARIALSLFAAEGANALNADIWSWSKAISKVPEDASFEQILEVLNFSSHDFDVLSASAKPRFVTLNYRSARDKKRIRFALAYSAKTLEDRAKNSEENNSIESMLASRGKFTFDLDHIYPKALVGTPQFDLTAGTEWVDTVGNLMLMHRSDNRGAQDSTPERKASHYWNQPILLAQTLAPFENASPAPNGRNKDVLDSARAIGAQDVTSWDSKKSYLQADFYFSLFMESLERNLGLS